MDPSLAGKVSPIGCLDSFYQIGRICPIKKHLVSPIICTVGPVRQVLSFWVELSRPSSCISDTLVRPTPAYDTWLALRQIQQSLPSSGSACCTSWWLLFAEAIILMRGALGCNGGQSVPSEEGGRICPSAQGFKELTVLTGRETFAALISSLRIFKTAGSPQ
jgi:hypothetical protein